MESKRHVLKPVFIKTMTRFQYSVICTEVFGLLDKKLSQAKACPMCIPMIIGHFLI